MDTNREGRFPFAVRDPAGAVSRWLGGWSSAVTSFSTAVRWSVNLCVTGPTVRAGMPSEQVLRWAVGAVGGTSVVSAESLGRGGHRASGTFRLRIEGPLARATDVILKVPVPGWIPDSGVITNARALQRAETHGLAAPRLIAADLDGRASGTVATLETFLSGDADLPPTVSVARLREAGAALARVHAVTMAPRTTATNPISTTSSTG